MKKLILASVLVVAGATSANAADIISQPTYTDPPAPAPVLDNRWGGVYVGGVGAYGFGDSQFSLGAASTDYDVDGFMGGITAGYNWQMGSGVLGVEADISYAGVDGSSSAAVCGTGCETEMDWFGTVRARAGYAYGNLMPYLTGGLAMASVDASGAGASDDETAYGWTAGLGLEYLVTDNVTVKGEYLYSRFNSDIGVGAGETSLEDLHTVRAGVNVKF